MLKTLPSESVNMCVTSPPYMGLRDYGTGHWEGGEANCDHSAAVYEARFKHSTSPKQLSNAGTGLEKHKKVCPTCGAMYVDDQIGLEETPEEYIQRLVDVFHEVKRVMKDDGTLWVNIADSYSGSGKGPAGKLSKDYQDMSKIGMGGIVPAGTKPKDMIGIPWMLAFALRADGWYLRQDIIWHKPNPMPESVTDRCTKSHEYIFLLSKSPTYYFDHEAMQEEATGYDGRKDIMLKGSPKYANQTYLPDGVSVNTTVAQGTDRRHFKNLQDKGQPTHTMHERRAEGLPDEQYPVRNKRDVWSVPVKPYSGAHFATFPEKLIEPCILAGSKRGGVILDVFSGSGTTGVVCAKLDREYIGIELNPEYVEMSEKRIAAVMEDIEAQKAQFTIAGW